MGTIAKTIKIIKVPHGQAPEAVRAGWVGCVLPCEPECGHCPAYVDGVISGALIDKIDGFSVHQAEALLILESHDPAAAAWFRAQGFPQDEKFFRFKLEETKVISTLSEAEEMAHGHIHRFDDMETGTMRQWT